jgi:general secretion pathway protein E/type IV pilus assembly protein PilB
MAGNIIGIVGQRLVRKLCAHCKEEYEPSRFERQILRLGVGSEAPPVYQALGCPQCEHTGFKGRLALMELLRFDGEVDEMVARRANVRELLKLARSKGYRTLSDDGVRRVLEGVTSMDEIARVLDLTEGIQ